MNGVRKSQSELGSIDIVLFSAAGWRFGLEARWVRSGRDTPARANGVRIEDLLGLAYPSDTAPDAPRQFLQLKLPGGDLDILVGTPVELLNLHASVIYAVPPMLAARTGLRALKALALSAADLGQGALLLLDACALPSPSRCGTAPK